METPRSKYIVFSAALITFEHAHTVHNCRSCQLPAVYCTIYVVPHNKPPHIQCPPNDFIIILQIALAGGICESAIHSHCMRRQCGQI